MNKKEIHDIRQELWILHKGFNVIGNTMDKKIMNKRDQYISDIAWRQSDGAMAVINRLTDFIEEES